MLVVEAHTLGLDIFKGHEPLVSLFISFDPQITVLDLLFMTGSDAPKFIWKGI